MWWMWYWKPVVATARAVGESLCPYGVLPCFSVRSVFGCRVVARAHVPMMILRGGLVYKTKQMAYPPAVAWSPPASHAAVWQCGLVVLSSLPVAGSAPGLALLWWLTVMTACPQAISVKHEWPCTDGFVWNAPTHQWFPFSSVLETRVRTFCLHTSSSVHVYAS